MKKNFKLALILILIFFPVQSTNSQESVYSLNYPNPIINSVSPKAINPGDLLTITGTNFGDIFYSESLYLGNTIIEKVESWSHSQITLIIPENIQPNRVYVSAGYSNGYRTNYSPGPFYYLQPVITHFDKNTAKPKENIIIHGKNFKNVFASDKNITYTVETYINDVKLRMNSWEDTKISATIPYEAKTGPIKIKLFAPEINDTVEGIGQIFTVPAPPINDPFYYYQEYLENLNIPYIWKSKHEKEKIIVAVIDDGIDINHPDLKNKIWSNSKEIPNNHIDDDRNGFIDDIFGWNFVSKSNDMTARGPHGTYVSGIIGAEKDNEIGVGGIVSNVELMALTVCESQEKCSMNAVSDAIKYAVDNGANIINLSLGTRGSGGYTQTADDIVKYAYDNNVLLIAAAGNGDVKTGVGVNLDISPQTPICNDNEDNMIIGVGSLELDGQKSIWSNYGNCVDIYTQGVNLYSTSIPKYNDRNEQYFEGAGTSFSAAIISGIAATLKSHNSLLNNRNIIDIILNNSPDKILNIENIFEIDLKAFEKQEKPTISIEEPIIFTESTAEKIPPLKKEETQQKETFIEAEKKLMQTIDTILSTKLSGLILLQVELQGQAWYVFPDTHEKYYLGRPNDAFDIMRKLGLGVNHAFMDQTIFPDRVLGKILIDVEDHGKAYYIYPKDKKAYYLGKPEDAFNVMRNLGLGITNDNIRKIQIGL